MFKFCLEINGMGQLNAYVKFIYILGDMAFLQTAQVALYTRRYVYKPSHPNQRFYIYDKITHLSIVACSKKR